jgi:hypothetical protein
MEKLSLCPIHSNVINFIKKAVVFLSTFVVIAFLKMDKFY